MDISIIICTYNRANILADALDSYATLTAPAGTTVELVIVDNNSNDATAQTAAQFALRHPETRYLFEPQAGLSHARNAGIKQSSGEIIVFVDDDVRFDPAWLVEAVRIFQDYPEAHCMGGKSIPEFKGDVPDWMVEELFSVYGSTHSGDAIKWMVYPECPFGLNMAFRRGVIGQIGMFNPQLGRKKNNLLSSEETEFFWRANQAGLKVIYAPNALLYHQIPQSRTCKNWVLARFYWQGVSEVVFDQLTVPCPRRILFKLVYWEIMALICGNGGKHEPIGRSNWFFQKTSFLDKCHQYYSLGLIKQLLIEALSFKRQAL